MAKVTITGASDDLIEVDGDMEEEFYALTDRNDGEDGGVLAFSDGTVLNVAYTGQGEGIEQAAVDDDVCYSDTARLEGDVRWVVYGGEFKVAR